MKTHFKIIFVFILLNSLLFGVSCREESEEIQELNDSETLKDDSTLVDLIQKTTMNDGSKDNIIDNTSCYSIKLPITLSVNETPITLETEEDYTLIEINFDEFDNDNDSIDFIFPITLISDDYTETVIINDELLNNTLQQCDENTLDIDNNNIVCIDFKYPVSISVFSSDKELLKTESLENDKELYLFINTLEEFDFADLILPITLIESDNTEVIVNTLADLKVGISDVEECDDPIKGDDDDDDDDDDGGSTNEAPKASASASTLSGNAPLAVTFDGSGSSDIDGDTLTYVWSFSDGTSANGVSTSKTFDEAGEYTATLTVTDPDGLDDSDSLTITVIKDQVNLPPLADISASTTSGLAPLDVTISGSGSTDPEGEVLTYSWDLGNGTTASGVSVSLTYEDAGSYDVTLTVTDIEGLTAKASITIDVSAPNIDDISTFTSLLTQNEWDIQKYQDDQSNETSNYTGYIFNFDIDGTSTVTLEEEVFEGTWNVITNSDGSLEVSFDYGEQVPLDKLSVSWIVKQIQDKRIMLEGVDDSGIGKDQLFFQQL